MLRELAGGLVGLIVIEIRPVGHDISGSPQAERDATLADFLAYLARSSTAEEPAAGEPTTCGATSRVQFGPSTGHRFGSKRVSRWARHGRVSADVKGLTVELDRAAARVRRKLAAAG